MALHQSLSRPPVGFMYPCNYSGYSEIAHGGTKAQRFWDGGSGIPAASRNGLKVRLRAPLGIVYALSVLFISLYLPLCLCAFGAPG